MTDVVTLAERQSRKLQAMRAALQALDSGLAAYGLQHGGRFVRYGSTATGTFRVSSDVDILADFPDERAGAACWAADSLCIDLGLVPDCRPVGWLRDSFVERARREGVTLP